MLFNIHDIIFEEISNVMLQQKNIRLKVARLDRIHPVVSGNKLFKLHYFLEAYKNDGCTSIETFGGAWSNHLVATAYACRQLHIPCKGYVRGEIVLPLSNTLQQCIEYGMQLEYLNRDDYRQIANLQKRESNALIIPEGGYHPLGAKGASLIMDSIKDDCTHICLPVGTATTLAGILQKATPSQTVIAIPVLKGLTDIQERISLLNESAQHATPAIWDQYHFGGYAKKKPELLDFMNELYEQHQLPTDFIYTAKMMYAVFDSIHHDLFKPGSNIVCLHTGGLQGNASLPAGSLIF